MAMPGELTQTQMGRLIGVTQVSWGWYEQGVRKPSWDNLTKLEKATGAPKSWVMDGLVKDVPPDLMGRLLKAEKELELRRKREAKKNRS
jgi:transcriptional regulator with XRE-family HTH domain